MQITGANDVDIMLDEDGQPSSSPVGSPEIKKRKSVSGSD